MRINSIPPKEIFYQYVHVKDKAVMPQQQSMPIDKVELTNEAKTFSAALRAAKDSMETRSPAETKRIEEIKQQIQNKTYSVSGYKVAEKLLDK